MKEGYGFILIADTYGVYTISSGDRIAFASNGFTIEGESAAGCWYRWMFTVTS